MAIYRLPVAITIGYQPLATSYQLCISQLSATCISYQLSEIRNQKKSEIYMACMMHTCTCEQYTVGKGEKKGTVWSQFVGKKIKKNCMSAHQ